VLILDVHDKKTQKTPRTCSMRAEPAPNDATETLEIDPRLSVRLGAQTPRRRGARARRSGSYGERVQRRGRLASGARSEPKASEAHQDGCASRRGRQSWVGLLGRTTMKKAKRARLEAAGWKVGTVRQFLGLSDEEAAFVDLKLALAEVCAVAASEWDSRRTSWPS